MKGWEPSELIFWIIVAILVCLILYLFANQLLMGYINVKFVEQP
jgi:hypothetical protein